MSNQHLSRDERGATIVELAFALPAFVMLLWGMVQIGLVYRANSGIQHSLGEGARFATLFPTPTDTNIKAEMAKAVYGIGPGTFNTSVTDVAASGYKDLQVTYTQPTDLLFLPGPTINIVKSKRVWVAGMGTPGSSGGGAGTGTGGTGTGTGGTGTGGTGTGGTGTGTGGDTGTGTGGTGTGTGGTGSGTGGTETGGTGTGGTGTGGTGTGGTGTGGTGTGTDGGTNTVCTKKNGKAC